VFKDFLVHLGATVGPWMYVPLGFFVFGEAAFFLGIFLPGEISLLVGGYLAAHGVLSLPLMLVVGVICAIAGDSAGYEVGRTIGPRLRGSRMGRRIKHSHWESAEAFLARHGGKAVLLGRSTFFLRALVPGLAGMAKMPYRTFVSWNATGGVLWGGGCVLLGFFFSKSIDLVASRVSIAGSVLTGVVVAVFVGRALWKRYRRKREEAPFGQR
jgi:membrane-associated protein